MDPPPQRRRRNRARNRRQNRQESTQGASRHSDERPRRRRGARRSGNLGKRLGFKRLEEMITQEPRETLHRLAADKSELENLIKDEDIRFELMVPLVGALANACRCKTSNETLKSLLVTLQQGNFVSNHLMKLIKEAQKTNMRVRYSLHLDTLSNLVKSVGTVLSSFLLNFPHLVYEVDEAIQCLDLTIEMYQDNGCELPDDVRISLDDLYNLCDTVMSEVSLWDVNDTRWNMGNIRPDGDFRLLPIFPMAEELQEGNEPVLHENIVNRGYDNVEHYLDIQYRLLREDFVAPLRDGISEYRYNTRTTPGKKLSTLKDMYIYNDVRVLEAKPVHDGIVYVTRFNVKQLSKVQWERSRRLVFGSLVCLSDDHFATLLFAVVNCTDRKGLSNGLVELRFHQHPETKKQLISTTFTMVESSAYFEAYRHVLKRLQNITEETFPLQRYIIDTNPVIQLPQYLQHNQHATYDLTPVAQQRKPMYTKVARKRFWPPKNDFDLDPSQMQAYKAALTEELCCIQGPPGTGKTFIGLKIVETLLLNKQVWCPGNENYPILLICYTNHALDQFLEGILNFLPEGIIRIGGRSTSEKLADFNLKEIRNKRARRKLRPKHQYQQVRDIRKEMVRLANSMRPLQKSVRVANTKVLFDSKLKDAIPPKHFRSLSVGISTLTLKRDDRCIAYWLGVEEAELEGSTVNVEVGELLTLHQDVAPPLQINCNGAMSNNKMQKEVLQGSLLQEYISSGLRQLGHLTEDEYLVNDVWQLPFIKRWWLYNYWVQEHQGHLLKLLDLATRGDGVLTARVLKAHMTNEHRKGLERYGRDLGITEGELMNSFLNITVLPLVMRLENLSIEAPDSQGEVIGRMLDNMKLKEVGRIPRENILYVHRCLSQSDVMTYSEIQRVVDIDSLSIPSRWRIYKYWVQEFCRGIKERLSISRRNVLRTDVLSYQMTTIQLSSLHDAEKHQSIGDIGSEQSLLYWLGAYDGMPLASVYPVLDEISHGDGNIDIKGEADIMKERRFLDDGCDEELKDTLQSLTERGGSDCEFYYHTGQNKPIKGSVHKDESNSTKMRRYVSTHLSSSAVMSEGRAHSVQDVWALSMEERWMLYKYWVSLFKEETQDKLRPLHDEYEKQVLLLKEARVEEDVDIIREASIIALTTTGAAKYHHLIQRVHPRIVVVEEAAEVLEAHIVTSLTESCQHLILIGDHQQLRPNPTVYELAQQYNLDISLFERLVNNNFPKHRLNLQHRMRPEIAELLKVHEDFYPGLLDDKSVLSYENVRGTTTNVFFMNHSHAELAESDNHSKSNEFEAEFLARLCQYFLQQEYLPEQITILTAYTGQLWNFKKNMPKSVFENIHVCPVDSYQGEENDIILLSFVRSNERGSIGFLKIANRVCVALSRAKKGLYCLGNFTLLSEKNALWKAITTCLRKRGHLGNSMILRCSNHPEVFTAVSSALDFKSVPEGGCTKPCGKLLECGHVCPLICHPRDPEHVDVVCRRKCTRFICDLKHPCLKRCHEKCDEVCKYTVKVLLPCGHKNNIQCYQRHSKHIECDQPCPKKLLCGHPCKTTCGKRCTVSCKQIVTYEYKCGHQFQRFCYQDLTDSDRQCNVKVKIRLACGHDKTIQCHQKNSDIMKCDKYCQKTLKCGHQCKEKCGELCTVRCKVLTKYTHKCGHQYHAYCGDAGIDRKCEMEIKRTLLCGHIMTIPCYRPSIDIICDRACNKILKCGHACKNKCGELCTIICKEYSKYKFSCGHSYRELCLGVVDHMCKLQIKKELPCGHKKAIACYQKTSTDVQCIERCNKALSCGHSCSQRCGQRCTVDCKVMIRQTLSCGHSRRVHCHQTLTPCDEPCQKMLKCRHQCKKKCGEHCTVRCKELYTLARGHSSRIQCYQRTFVGIDLLCDRPCQKTLKCGHPCKKKCGESCTVFCEELVTYKFKCGHSYRKLCWKIVDRECKMPISKTLVCGHSRRISCHLEPYISRSCIETCKKRLTCGHPCSKRCGEYCVCSNLCQQ